jgi:predicted nucleic acid-binding protein
MNGVRILIDTNTAIYLLNGDSTLARLLDQKSIYISFVSQLELLSFPGITVESEKMILEMIDSCVVIDINNSIKREVIQLRRKYSIKLPDSIIAATAIYFDLPLLTADRGFAKIEELNLMLYER